MLVRGVILARLLLPEDFGLFGLASVIIGFAAMFSDVGAGVFLIYRYDDIDKHADTAFWVNLGIATLLGAGVTWKEFALVPREAWGRNSPPRVVIDCWRVLKGLEGCDGVIYVQLGKGGLRGC